MKILVSPTSMCIHQDCEAMRTLKAFTDDIVISPYPRNMTAEELMELIEDVDGVVAGTDDFNADVIAKANKLKVISRYGAGVDSVDLAAAKAKGIAVTNTPGANAQAVAELAFGHMMALARKTEYQSKALQSGKWVSVVGKQMMGKTVGILGYGNIGRRFAKMAKGLDMTVLAYDPYLSADRIRETGAEPATLDEIFTQADAITVHMPLTPETKHLIGAEAIAKMRDDVILINTARGGIIDEEAAYDGLVSGKIWGLALDVYETEPPMGSKLFELDNVISTPHAGAHTFEAVENMGNMSVKNCIDVLSGNDCPFIVNR
ncbi:MAG: phosphoglycerate dehydrogenase [Clostridia bacterium]|nr:phosphoglycerate dehydrogenase [Clostridia bacterium]MBR3195695.1 phosphoglycerate dehydrogenase [Clostridia bacterium]